MEPIRCIVLPVDFSEHSARATEMAGDLAKELGANIHVIHVIEMPAMAMTPYDIGIPTTFFQEVREAAKRKLAELKEGLERRGLSVESHLAEAPATVAIQELVEEVGADLVVMGTRGNTGLKHVLLGSVAERVLRHVPCPVLTVK
jgi:nucleotide-binding universal stress UspA family protein